VLIINGQTCSNSAGWCKLVEQWKAVDLFVNFRLMEHSVHIVSGIAACLYLLIMCIVQKFWFRHISGTVFLLVNYSWPFHVILLAWSSCLLSIYNFLMFIYFHFQQYCALQEPQCTFTDHSTHRKILFKCWRKGYIPVYTSHVESLMLYSIYDNLNCT
jgi:hypothetical protein